MKKQNLNKKLSLRKETISNLRNIKGGYRPIDTLKPGDTLNVIDTL